MLQRLSLLFLVTQSLALPLTCLGDEGVLVGMIAAASLARLGALLASCSELSNICMKLPLHMPQANYLRVLS